MMKVTKVDVRTKVMLPRPPKGNAGRLIERMGFWACQAVWTAAAAGALALVVMVLLS